MKKLFTIALVLLMTMAMLAGCGGSGGSDGSGSGGSDQGGSADSIKTFGDIEALDLEEFGTSHYPDEKMLIYAFKLGDTYYRASSKLDPEVSQELWDLEFDDPEYDAKYKAIMDSIEIDELTDLSDQILSQSELDALAGKTGQELMDEGWVPDGTYNLDEMGFWMNYGPFVYNVHFDADGSGINTETFEVEEGIKDWPVTGAEFVGLGNGATDL